MPPRPHPVILVALAVACFVVAFMVAPRRALPNTPHRAAAAGHALAAQAAGAGRGTVTARHALAVHAAGAGRGTVTARHVLAVRPPPPNRAAPSPPPHATWRWPLRGRVVGAFRLTPHAPFARGQRRGIDVAASPGATVRAACPGRVTFAGPLPHAGLAVTVRCGPLVATYLHLGGLVVRRWTHAAVGQRLGALGPDGRLRLGARRAADRRGYVDPLALLRDPRPGAPPVLGPAPRPRRPRPAPVPIPALRPAPAPAPTPAARRHLPWPAYPAVALIATALPVGSLVHRRRRGSATTAAATAHEGP